MTTGGTGTVRRRLLADLRPLRESREYRRLWLGSALSGIGSRMTAIAVPVQVYTLTHSSLAVGHVRRQGRAMLLSVTVWGTALACFALAPQLALAVPLLAVAGAADVVTVVFRSTIIQVNTPDALLGRINGVNFVVGEGGPRLGDVEAGVVAALTSPVVSAVSGGIACVVGAAVLAVAVPAFARYDAAAAAGRSEGDGG